MFKGYQKILVKFLLLTTCLMFKRCALGYRIVLLGVARRNLLAIDATFKNFDGCRIVR